MSVSSNKVSVVVVLLKTQSRYLFLSDKLSSVLQTSRTHGVKLCGKSGSRMIRPLISPSFCFGLPNRYAFMSMFEGYRPISALQAIFSIYYEMFNECLQNFI